jgi:type IV secretion system protein VirD4
VKHSEPYFVLLICGLLTAGALRWCFGPHSHLPRFRVRYLRLRLHLRLHPGRGLASVFELWLRWGRLAAFRRSGRVRPSLNLWQRLADPRAHSVRLGRAQYRHPLAVPLEEHVLIMAPPRTFKTALLASVELHFPGPVVSTTTKHDVFELTSGIRARVGPVHVFNPQGIGSVPSTFRWNPLEGCAEPAVAIRRADSFAYAVSMDGVEGGGFWSDKASDYLRACFHAAALAGLDLRQVAAWISAEDATEAEEILADAGRDLWAGRLRELRGAAERTAATVRMTMSRALTFLDDPVLADCVLPAAGEGLNIAEFLASSGTLYMIAESRNERAPLAALYACLADEIHWQACLLGSRQRGGRLDPPLLMALDEVTQICPVPLPHWLADSGGKGIQIMPVVHGEAQLRTRWGKDGAQVVLDTCGVKVWLPGITDTATLKMAGELCGQAAFTERVHQRTRDGARSERRRVWHDVMTPDMVRQLPAGHGLVIRGSHAPVIARLAVAWKDPVYKAARRAGTATARLAPAPGPAALPGAARPGAAVPPRGHRPPRRLRPVPDLDIEAAGGEGGDPPAYPWGRP